MPTDRNRQEFEWSSRLDILILIQLLNTNTIVAVTALLYVAVLNKADKLKTSKPMIASINLTSCFYGRRRKSQLTLRLLGQKLGRRPEAENEKQERGKDGYYYKNQISNVMNPRKMNLASQA